MKKNIIWLCVWSAFFFVASRYQFVIEGQEAIAAANQVKTGSEYIEARVSMNFYSDILNILKHVSVFFIGWNIVSFAFNFFKKENAN